MESGMFGVVIADKRGPDVLRLQPAPAMLRSEKKTRTRRLGSGHRLRRTLFRQGEALAP